MLIARKNAKFRSSQIRVDLSTVETVGLREEALAEARVEGIRSR